MSERAQGGTNPQQDPRRGHSESFDGGFDLDAFGSSIAEEVDGFLKALQVISTGDRGTAVPLLLLEVSRILLAGARLGAQTDFTLDEPWQPDVGPDTDEDELRLRLAILLGPVDTYSFVFDPYVPEVVEGNLSDDLASVAADLDNGLRHYRAGNTSEALWWWQFSYVANWGNLAGAVLNALLTVVSHDRLDEEHEGEEELVREASTALDEPTARS